MGVSAEDAATRLILTWACHRPHWEIVIRPTDTGCGRFGVLPLPPRLRLFLFSCNLWSKVGGVVVILVVASDVVVGMHAVVGACCRRDVRAAMFSQSPFVIINILLRRLHRFRTRLRRSRPTANSRRSIVRLSGGLHSCPSRWNFFQALESATRSSGRFWFF